MDRSTQLNNVMLKIHPPNKAVSTKIYTVYFSSAERAIYLLSSGTLHSRQNFVSA